MVNGRTAPKSVICAQRTRRLAGRCHGLTERLLPMSRIPENDSPGWTCQPTIEFNPLTACTRSGILRFFEAAEVSNKYIIYNMLQSLMQPSYTVEMHKNAVDRELCISAVRVRGRLRLVGRGHSDQASTNGIRAGSISAPRVDQDLVDHRDRAVAPNPQHEDLARGGDPARERRDVHLMGNQDNGFPGRQAEQELPEFGGLRASPVPGSGRNEFSAGRSSAGPRSRNRAVSRQRHHWLVTTRSTVTPAARIFDQVHEAFMEDRRSSKRSSAPTTAIAAVRRSTSTPMPAGSRHGASSIGCSRSRIDGRRGRRTPSDRGFRRNAGTGVPQSVVNVTQRSVRQAKHTPRNPGPGGTLLYRPCLCPPNGKTQSRYLLELVT